MKKGFIAIACVLGLMLAAGQGRAALIELSQFDEYYVGSILTGEPSSETLELGYIQNLITLLPEGTATIGSQDYSRAGSDLSPLLPISGSFTYTSPVGANTWAVSVNDPAYLYGKYDGPNGGVLVWLVDAQYGDTISVPLRWGPTSDKDYGISHLAAFSDGSPVPVPGTLILFGSGLVGLATIARRRLRK